MSSTPTDESTAKGPLGLNRIELALIAFGLVLAGSVFYLDFVVHASEVVLFGGAALTLVLLAWLLGESTDQLGHSIGGRSAGIMNATFGNLPELIIVVLLIQAATAENGLIDVAKASIMGSVLGNMLFVLGAAFLVGGLRNGPQIFTREFSGLHSSMVQLAVVGLAIPTAIHFGGSRIADEHIHGLSIATAIVLFTVYIAQLYYFLSHPGTQPIEKGAARWSLRASIPVLVVSALLVAGVSEVLVQSIEHTVKELGISATFMGFILVPIVGNIAEHLVAVQVAWRNDMDFAMTIALGSSVQVALGLVPLALFISLAMDLPSGVSFDLFFEPLQMLALGLAAIVVPTLFDDGKTSWIEGLQLLAVYVLIAIGFWY